MALKDEEAVHLARELIYYAGHGYTKENRKRYPILLALPQVAGRLPASATENETANHLDSVLIESIRGYRLSITPRFTKREIPIEELREHWSMLLGLPPYPRAGMLHAHRIDVALAVDGGSVATWRRRGGNEEEFVGYLADYLLSPPGPLAGGSWVVRTSSLDYSIGKDHSIERVNCRYDAETLRNGVKTFGVDHRCGVGQLAAEYTFIEGSVTGCETLTHKRLDDKSLSIDLLFDPPLPKEDRRMLGYSLGMTVKPEGIQVIRLNAAVLVWEHKLKVTFAEDVLPLRIWWFAHHIGTGAGEEPDDDRFDLEVTGLTVHQSFAGLRQGPDYGIAFRWEERGTRSDAVTSVENRATA